MMESVSRLSGMLGMRNVGSDVGNWPMSETVRRSRPRAIETMVSTMIQMRGEGPGPVGRGGGRVKARGDWDDGKHDDTDEGRGNGSRQPRQEVNDRQPGGDHRIGVP